MQHLKTRVWPVLQDTDLDVSLKCTAIKEAFDDVSGNSSSEDPKNPKEKFWNFFKEGFLDTLGQLPCARPEQVLREIKAIFFKSSMPYSFDSWRKVQRRLYYVLKNFRLDPSKKYEHIEAIYSKFIAFREPEESSKWLAWRALQPHLMALLQKL